ncbi:hypothetical protein [Massilia eburnea]|uniref:hypothetical protein n=1 Tax=Massilia eburnea TaxID=1776165 RepID=UPI003D6C0CDB
MMSVDTFTLSGKEASVILRLFEWDDACREALKQSAYDAIEPKSALGSFEPLADFSGHVHWLYYPDVESSAGLETLIAVRRITFGDELPQPEFDLRKLPQLRVLEFRGAVPDARHLNHPRLRYLEVEDLKAANLAFLAEAKELGAMSLRRCALTSLKGCEALGGLRELRLLGAKKLEDISGVGAASEIEILEIAGAKSLRDMSAIHSLGKLRYLFVEAEESSQAGLAWLANLPHLECAGLWLETTEVDWSVLARHPRLYDIVFFAHAGFELPDDEALLSVLQAHGKRVLKVTRFPKARRPGIRIEFDPPADLAAPKPLHAYQTNLLTPPASLV